MRRLVLLLILAVPALAQTGEQKGPPPTLKSILLDQLQSVHNKKDWFVDANTAVAGLTADQANWTDGKGNHSVGQLAYHLVFWNRLALANLKGEKSEKFNGNNDETFTKFDSEQWQATVKELDEVLSGWEKAVEGADEKTLDRWAPIIARVGTHNAYHVGQIVFVRKEQGSWDPEKGVK